MTYLSTPRFLLSTASSPVLSGSSYLEIGRRLPLSGIDLDYCSNMRTRLQRWSSVSLESGDRIRSVWIPADSLLLQADPLEYIGPVPIINGPYPRVVIDRPDRRSRDDLANQVATAIRLRQIA